MIRLRAAAREIVGLFLDDGFLAGAALAMVGVAGLLIKVARLPPVLGGFLLIAGCIAALLISVRRAAQASRPRRPKGYSAERGRLS
jgi:hypothetical protein